MQTSKVEIQLIDALSMGRQDLSSWDAVACNLVMKDGRVSPDRVSGFVVTRTGARVTGAVVDERYLVSYAPAMDLVLPGLQSENKKTSLGFEVFPFVQLPIEKATGRYDVDKAGELLAVAIARQLGHMEFKVQLKLNDSMVQQLDAPAVERVTIAKDGSLGLVVETTWKKLAFRWQVTGAVRFWIEREKLEKGETVTAHLGFLPVISMEEKSQESSGGTRQRSVYQPRPLQDRETIRSDRLSGSSRRRKEAASRVLHRLVRKFLSAPELEASLLRCIRENVRKTSTGVK